MIKYSDLKQRIFKEEIEEDLVYSDIIDINEDDLASSIKENHNIDKLTNTIIDNYKAIIESNSFYIDPVVQEFTVIDSNGKYRYTLADGKVVAISEETQELLSNLLANKPDIVNYMQESVDNFMEILRKI